MIGRPKTLTRPWFIRAASGQAAFWRDESAVAVAPANSVTYSDVLEAVGEHKEGMGAITTETKRDGDMVV